MNRTGIDRQLATIVEDVVQKATKPLKEQLDLVLQQLAQGQQTPSTESAPRYFRVTEVAEFLGVCRDTAAKRLKEWEKDGRIPPRRALPPGPRFIGWTFEELAPVLLEESRARTNDETR